MTDSRDGRNSEKQVRLVESERGQAVHIEVDGDIICNPNIMSAEDEVDGLTEKGLCESCKRFGKLSGVVEVPT